MKRLGYTRYVAQGGDQGATVTDAMARQAPNGLVGIHLNFLSAFPTAVLAAVFGGEFAAGPLQAGRGRRRPSRADKQRDALPGSTALFMGATSPR